MTTARELGTIERVDDIREYWPNEANDFTPWLARNISLLGDALSMDLEALEQEASVGAFSLDIRAHDLEANRPVIIENQFGATDHRHLGQLLTYATGFEADVVVWIAEEFRDEHRATLDYLNQRTGESTEFFGVVVELWKIDDSRAAPHFKLVATPNDWSKQSLSNVPAPDRASIRDEAYKAFWELLIDDLVDEGFTPPIGQQTGGIGRIFHQDSATYPIGRLSLVGANLELSFIWIETRTSTSGPLIYYRRTRDRLRLI